MQEREGKTTKYQNNRERRQGFAESLDSSKPLRSVEVVREVCLESSVWNRLEGHRYLRLPRSDTGTG